MTAEPKFSVLIANYNNARFINDALESVYRQTYKNWEIIIVDDASTDDSRSLLESLQENEKIKVVYLSENRGCGGTKRETVLHAAGEIAGFLDPDDKITEDAIEKSVNAHLQNPEASLVYSLFYTCDERFNIREIPGWIGRLPAGKTNLEFSKVSHFATFKIASYKKTDGIDPAMLKAVDKDLYYRLEEVGELFFIDEPMYYYRVHPQGVASMKGNRIEAFKWAFFTKKGAYLRRKQSKIENIQLSNLRKDFRRIMKGDIKKAYLNREYFRILTLLPKYVYPTQNILLGYRPPKYKSLKGSQ